MSVYHLAEFSIAADEFYLVEQDIYGSSRLGYRQQKIDLLTTPTILPEHDGIIYTFRGYKRYELSNHLGNVLTVVSDRRTGMSCASGFYSFYEADIITARDYFAHGMTMPDRQWTASSEKYRYSFNGKESTDEWDVEGNNLDYGFRIYNPRLGRFLSVDPLFMSYPFFTPYQFASNTPIAAIDLDGLESKLMIWYYPSSVLNPPITVDLDIAGKMGDQMLFIHWDDYGFRARDEDNNEMILDFSQVLYLMDLTMRSMFDYFSQSTLAKKSAVSVMNPSQWNGQGSENCWAACVEMVKKTGVVSPGLRDNGIQTALENESHTTLEITKDAIKGVEAIDNSLDVNKKPIVVGINHTLDARLKSGKTYNEGTTDHFVVIMGRGYDEEKQQTYYTFYDPGRSSDAKGTDTNKNRLYLNEDGSLTGNDYKNRTITVTSVRKNE